MKINFLLVSLYFLTWFASGQNQSITPKKGKMIFTEQLVVVNEQKLDSSLQLKKPVILNLFRDMTFDLHRQKGLEIDSSAINLSLETNFIPYIDLVLDPRNNFREPINHIYVFEDSIIKYQEQNSILETLNEIEVINRSNGKLSHYTLEDSVMTLNSYKFSMPIKQSNKNIRIYEYRDIRKNILGFDCFKIIIIKNENFLKDLEMLEVEISSEIKAKYINFLEPTSEQILYVTEQISCKYHPTINLSEVLDNYYPLEISSTDGVLEGTEKRVILKEISIK
ncbi:hypothetical protein [Cellulophaga algicola]|nr:hypothetical protein [Cellulophaga algicola]